MSFGTQVPQVAIILSYVWAQANGLKNNVWPQSPGRPRAARATTRAVLSQQSVPLSKLAGAPAHPFPATHFQPAVPEVQG